MLCVHVEVATKIPTLGYISRTRSVVVNSIDSAIDAEEHFRRCADVANH